LFEKPWLAGKKGTQGFHFLKKGIKILKFKKNIFYRRCFRFYNIKKKFVTGTGGAQAFAKNLSNIYQGENFFRYLPDFFFI